MKKHWSSQLATRRVLERLNAAAQGDGILSMSGAVRGYDPEVVALRDLGYVKFFERRDADPPSRGIKRHTRRWRYYINFYKVTSAGLDRLRKEGMIA